MAYTNALIYDLDLTLCTKKEKHESYSDVKPIQPVIDQLNKFYDEGYTIIISTARNMFTQNNDVGRVIQNVGEDTLRWLRENGVKYHSIQFGKPYGKFYCDDKAIRPEELLSLESLDNLEEFFKNKKDSNDEILLLKEENYNLKKELESLKEQLKNL